MRTTAQKRCARLWKPSGKQTKLCLICFEPFRGGLRSFFGCGEGVCTSCLREMAPVWQKKNLCGAQVYSIYRYEGKVRTLLYQFKGCKDIALAPIFFLPFRLWIRIRFLRYIIVPVPSFSGRDVARGFNHVEEMIAGLHIPVLRCIEKSKDVKQSSLKLRQRERAREHFALLPEAKGVSGKRVLLVDDVLTTGSTLSACIALMKRMQAKKIAALTMAYTRRDKGEFDERFQWEKRRGGSILKP